MITLVVAFALLGQSPCSLSLRRNDLQNRAQPPANLDSLAAKLAEAQKLRAANDRKGAEQLLREVLAEADRTGRNQLSAEACYNLAIVLVEVGDSAGALPFCERAADTFGKLGQAGTQGNALHLAGLVTSRLRNYEKALDFYTRALAIRQKLGVPLDIAASLNNLGTVYSALGQLEEARSSHLRAHAIYEKSDNPAATANSLNNLGDTYTDLRQFDKALDYYTRALAAYEKLGNKRGVSRVLFQLGNTSKVLGQFEKALGFFAQSLEICKELKDSGHVMDALFSLGSVYYSIGQFDKAIDFHTQALELEEKGGHPQEIAESHNGLGMVYDARGQFDRAFDHYARALAIYQEAKSDRFIAPSLNNIGLVYYHLGQLNKALDLYTQALSTYERLAQGNTGVQGGMADCLNNIGIVHYSLGEFQSAVDFYRRALAIYEKESNPAKIATCLNNHGKAYVELGQLDKALDFHTRSLAKRRELGNQQEIAYSLANLGYLHFALGQPDQAIELCSKSLAIRDRLGNQQDIAFVLEYLGQIYESVGRLDDAESSYARAIQLSENLSHQVGDPSDLAAFQDANVGSLCARFSDLRLRQKKPSEALAMADRERGFALYRQIAFNTECLASYFKPEVLEGLKAAQQRAAGAATVLRLVIQKLEGASGTVKKQLEKAKSERQREKDDAYRAYFLLRDSLLGGNPELQIMLGDKHVSGARLVQLGRQEPNTLFVEYSLLDDRLNIFAIAGGEGLKTFTVALKRGDLERAVAALNENIETGKGDEVTAQRELFALILGPLEKDGLLGDKYKHIVFVPDGPLLEVSFAALIDSKGKRLIESRSVGNLVSLGVLTWDITPRDATDNMLVLADPTGDGGQRRVSPSRGGEFGPLLGARVEGKSILDLVPSSTELVGNEAKEAAFKAEAGKYSILHFATHGYLSQKNEMLSALVLASEDPGKSKEDGFLEAGEIVGLPLSAQLAVLSACETGDGIKKGGEGLMGLTWAFRAAGCPAVLASKWKVDDEATRRIMVRFYQELLKPGTRKDDALRTAILAEMQVQEKEHPTRAESVTGGTKPSGKRSNSYYWAAFQLIGDPSPLRPLPKH